MILYDTPRTVSFRGRDRRSSHLMSDMPGAEGRDELDTFAASIGLLSSWRQKSGTPTEHYDLFDGAIRRAELKGAVLVSPRDLINRCVRPKRMLLSSP